MPKGNEVSRTISGEVESPKPFQRYLAALSDEASLTEGFTDAGEITAMVASRMLEAGSLEDAFEAQDSGLISGQQLKDIEHEVTSFDVVKSSKQDATLGHYLRVTATALEDVPRLGLKIGEEFTYAVGAANVVTLLYKARQMDRLPLRVVIRGKSTGDGDNELLLLRLAPRRA
jgi:hypothetical protein